jgi:hypothetical protein
MLKPLGSLVLKHHIDIQNSFLSVQKAMSIAYQEKKKGGKQQI